MRILKIVFSQQLYIKKNAPKIYKNAQRYIFHKSSNLFFQKISFPSLLNYFFSQIIKPFFSKKIVAVNRSTVFFIRSSYFLPPILVICLFLFYKNSIKKKSTIPFFFDFF
ncbi:MAG: hypothetical protein RL757_1035 [Bacteroidota bacterium]|jgi:hypothetical protein